MKRTIGATLFGALLSLQAVAEVVVVVHPDNQATITKQTVKRLFLGKETAFPNGKAATIVQQPATNQQPTSNARNLTAMF